MQAHLLLLSLYTLIVHTSLTDRQASCICDIGQAVPQVINTSSSQLVSGDWIASD